MKRARKSKRRNMGYTTHNKINLIPGGRFYFDLLLKMINEAKESIQLQVYIYDDDDTGKEVTAALISAAKRNVQVYLLADGYASQKLSKSFIREVKAAGIHFRFFEPLFRSRHSYFGRRLHHKVIVVDGLHGMLGGINIGNNYNDMPEHPAWLDFAVRVEGEIVGELCALCEKTWRGYLPAKRIALCKETEALFNNQVHENCQLRLRRNDWVKKKNQVSRSYIEMFRTAKDQITMMSSYYLPGRVIRKNLIKAVKRGVKVKLILAGISDVMVAKNAERYMYGWVFKNNIELYEYKPRVLHGKVAVSDTEWATVGSYNVNDISAFASIELNIDIKNDEFASMLETTLETIIQNDCVLITSENFDARNGLFLNIWQKACYLFIRALFYLFTINFKKQD